MKGESTVRIKVSTLERFIGIAADYAREMDDAARDCRLDEEIESCEAHRDEALALATFGRRMVEAGKHGREIKGQV